MLDMNTKRGEMTYLICIRFVRKGVYRRRRRREDKWYVLHASLFTNFHV
jgi:hypothetical protein